MSIDIAVLEPVPGEERAEQEHLQRAAAAVKLLTWEVPLHEALEDEHTGDSGPLAAALQEAVDPEFAAKHPRWPKGSPGGKGGEFMHVGERFVVGGKEYEIAHLVGGRVYAHRATHKAKEAGTDAFELSADTDGSPTIKGMTPAAPKLIKGGQGPLAGQAVSTVTVVDPYVDQSTHDPSIPIPPKSELTPEQWLRFGKVDQEHYTALQEKFGKWGPGLAKDVVDKSYAKYDASAQDLVKNSYQSQYGSSSGYSLSLTSLFKHGSGTQDLEKLTKRREKAKALQAEHKAAVQWDLYNRTLSPDVALFHKDYDYGPSWWKQNFIDGDDVIFSGLSQSHSFRQSFFGSYTFATPTAIRHVLMSTYSAQPIPGEHHFPGELEVAIADQFRADERSVAFDSSVGPNRIKWLEGETNQPVGGHIIERFQEALASGEMLPTPAAAANIQMTGVGGKQWVDPPAAAAELEGAEKLPGQQGAPVDPKTLPKDLPWAYTDDDGNPMPTVAKESGFQAGDYMMGLKGTLYWVGSDPGDTSGYGLRYHKIDNGKFTGESWPFEGGGTNQYYKLAVDYPEPVVASEKEPTFDHNAWAQTKEAQFVGKLKPGDKFKVHGNPYEIVEQLNASMAKIKHLETGTSGTINTDYPTPTLVPKEGYIPEASLPILGQPQAGDFFAHEGKRYTVSSLLKDGTVRAKPLGGKVEKFESGHEALTGLFRPSLWEPGDKAKLRDMTTGDFFQAGAGQKIRPYRVLAVDEKGKVVVAANLETGKLTTIGWNKSYARLVPAETPGNEKPTPETPKSTPVDPGVAFDASAYIEGDPLKVNDMEIGQVFKTKAGGHYELVKKGPKSGAVAKNLQTGKPYPAISYDTEMIPLEAKAEAETPYAELTPGDAVQLGKLQIGDQFEIGPEDAGKDLFQVVAKAKGEEDNVTVAPVTPAGVGPSMLSDASFPDKLVYLVAKADEAKLPAPAQGTDAQQYPDAVEGGFVPFQSVVWGPGGGNTNHKVSEMAQGTVFADKSGSLWKVKVSGAHPVITNGWERYSVNGELRGRIDEESIGAISFVDTTSDVTSVGSGSVKQPPPPAADLPAPSPTPDPTPAVDLPQPGATVKAKLIGGGELQGEAIKVVQDSVGAMVKIETGDGSTHLFGAHHVTQIAPPPDDPDNPEPPAPKFAVDQTVVLPNGDFGVVNTVVGEPGQEHQVEVISPEDGLVVGQYGESQLWEMLDPAAPEVAEVGSLGALAPGDEFSLGDDAGGFPGDPPFKVVSVVDKFHVIYEDGMGKQFMAPPHVPVQKTVPSQPEAVPKPSPSATTVPPGYAAQEVIDALLASHGWTLSTVPEAEVSGYKSTWGTGGKYKHHRLSELSMNDQVRDKTGKSMTVVGAVEDSVIVEVWGEGLRRVDRNLRVRLLSE